MIRTSLWKGTAIALSVLAWTVAPAVSQDVEGTAVDPRFALSDLPTPNVYRTGAGHPGPQYWQQRVDYDIRATLDPATASVSGSETINYTNRSPDTLRFLWVQLDQNLFAPGSQGAQTFPQEGRFGGSEAGGGYTISRVEAAGRALETRINGTLMRVDLAEPLPPGGTSTFAIDWSFVVPETGADRMGHDGDHYLLAQWYPRLAVYDDVHGWNTMPYLGQGEFYLEYGDFDVALTVPAAYLVGATGELQNADEVLTAAQRERLASARGGTEVVNVVTAAELGDPAAFRPTTTGTLTWRFHAEDVRDFAWGTGPRLVWDATGAGDALIQALYRPEARAWSEAAAMTRHSIEFYSDYLGEYPYPTATAIEGPALGMEYPMVVFVAPEEDREGLFDVLDHEWGHMWFPMIVGSDERRYAWMDEGFNTFLNQLSKRAYFPESTPELLNVAQYVMGTRTYQEQPIGTLPDEFGGDLALGIGAYVKPAVMLNALRAIAGDGAFDAALGRYFEVWSFKHPQPADFYRIMQDELGIELGWFWHGWIETTATSDMAVLGVDQDQAGDRWIVTVSVDQRGELLMPARVVASTDTGASATVTIPVEAFYGSDRATATVSLPARVERITVNAGPEWGDVNPQNNTWTR